MYVTQKVKVPGGDQLKSQLSYRFCCSIMELH